jgi:PAS domain S-box-containing protein
LSEDMKPDARAESEQWLSTTLRCIGDAVIATDAEGRIALMNPASEALTGWSREESLGRDFRQVLHVVNEESHDAMESLIARVLREGSIVGAESRTLLIARDGTKRPIDHSVAPIRDEKGAVLGVVLVFHDITARRRAEVALRKSENRWKLALRAIRMGTWEWNRETNGVVWDETLEALYGLPPGGFGGTYEAFLSLVHPDDREYVIARVAEALGNGPDYEVEFRAILPDGRVRWIADKGRVVYDEIGRPLGITGVCWDTTDHKESEIVLREQKEQIELLNRRLQQTIAETHHRVKNNLQVIASLMDMQIMQHKKIVPLSELERLAQHLRALANIHDLLTRSARIGLDADDLSVKEVVETLMPLVQDIAKERPIRFHVEDVRLPVRQGTALGVLVNELVSNAVKHGTGAIEVMLKVVDGQVRLVVENAGPGFPEGFNPSQAAHTGLELVESLSRWDLHGTTAYENRPEGGAQVVIVFPLDEAVEPRMNANERC